MYGTGYSDGGGYGNGYGGGGGYGNGYGGGDGNGNDDGTVLLLGMEIDPNLQSLLLPLTVDTFSFARKLQLSSSREEYEAIIAILELRREHT